MNRRLITYNYLKTIANGSIHFHAFSYQYPESGYKAGKRAICFPPLFYPHTHVLAVPLRRRYSNTDKKTKHPAMDTALSTAVTSITGRRIRNVSVYPGLHHYVVLHPGLVCHHRQGGSIIIPFNNRFFYISPY